MRIVTFIRRSSEISGGPQLAISPDGRNIRNEALFFDLNEPDRYALEEARLIKERFDGSITVITVEADDKSAEEVLRKCIALGADEAIALVDSNFIGSDGWATSKILYSAIKSMKFDLILTGCVATDNGYSQVGVQLGQLLDIPHASYVTKIDIKGKRCIVRRELEEGLSEVLELEFPAILTIQTGINIPRYPSFKKIFEAKRKKIKFFRMRGLGLREDEVGHAGSKIIVEKLFLPRSERKAQIIQGDTPEQKAYNLFYILKEKELI